jgi:hypothetical protein
MLRITALLFVILVDISIVYSQSVGVGTTTPSSSAQLEVNSTAKGFLPPRMTTAQRDAIVGPAAGLVIFNTSSGLIEFYNGSFWSSFDGKPVTTTLPATRRLMGGTNSDEAYSVQVTADGGYIIGGFSTSSNTGTLTGITTNGQSDFYVMKLDASANIQWQRLLGGTGQDNAARVRQTTDGGYIVVGTSNSSNTGTFAGVTSNGLDDYGVVKLNAAGNVVWRRLLGGTGSEFATAVAATADGGCIISGFSSSSNTGTLAGFFTNGNDDAWVIKLDAAGTTQWQRLIGGNQMDEAHNIAQAPDGTYIMVAHSESSNTGTLAGLFTNGDRDAWIVKFNSVGTILWQRLLGGSNIELMRSVVATPDNGCLVVAASASSNTGTMTGLINNGSWDMFLLKLDGAGTTQWQKLYGGIGSDQQYDAVATADGGYVITGTAGSTSINTGNLYGLSNTSQLIWTVKVDNIGNMQWQQLHGSGTAFSDGAYGIARNAAGDLFIVGSTPASNSGSFSGLFNSGLEAAYIIRLNQYGVQY